MPRLAIFLHYHHFHASFLRGCCPFQHAEGKFAWRGIAAIEDSSELEEGFRVSADVSDSLPRFGPNGCLCASIDKTHRMVETMHPSFKNPLANLLFMLDEHSDTENDNDIHQMADITVLGNRHKL
ncbi:hypothetical protein PILCRDRAFT_826261 [Piloderma croceum F 1598]|uniref:Uncharacterized protein n=1 Tax=Piloderma croceum (strain F 1598) TaxID=765440 RepID=A0A0C3F971_PILCF|nr:hypothetical protein PILCRDRAFT_826261 [Piloderma croceum F 1598]